MDKITCKVDRQGRITLPLEWRKAHQLGSGSDVTVLLTGDRLEIQTASQSIDEACQLAAKYLKGKPAMEMLREDRKQQVQREKKLEGRFSD